MFTLSYWNYSQNRCMVFIFQKRTFTKSFICIKLRFLNPHLSFLNLSKYMLALIFWIMNFIVLSFLKFNSFINFRVDFLRKSTANFPLNALSCKYLHLLTCSICYTSNFEILKGKVVQARGKNLKIVRFKHLNLLECYENQSFLFEMANGMSQEKLVKSALIKFIAPLFI